MKTTDWDAVVASAPMRKVDAIIRDSAGEAGLDVKGGNLYVGPSEMRPCPPDTEDLTGRRFGKLTVLGLLRQSNPKGKKPAKWVCRCDCGNYAHQRGKALNNGARDRCDQCDAWEQVKSGERYRDVAAELAAKKGEGSA